MFLLPRIFAFFFLSPPPYWIFARGNVLFISSPSQAFAILHDQRDCEYYYALSFPPPRQILPLFFFLFIFLSSADLWM